MNLQDDGWRQSRGAVPQLRDSWRLDAYLLCQLSVGTDLVLPAEMIDQMVHDHLKMASPTRLLPAVALDVQVVAHLLASSKCLP